MRRTVRLAFMALAIAGVPLALLAAQAEAQQTPNAATPDPGAGDFVARGVRSAERNMALLTLAAERAENPKVKHFARTIAGDLDASRKRLQGLAPPPEPDASRPSAETGTGPGTGATSEIATAEIPFKRPQYQRLRALSGTAFDKQFLSGVILGYENAIRRYEAEAARRDERTRAYATESLPRLAKRLEEARALLAEIEGSRN